MKPWLIEHQLLLSQQFSQHTMPHALLVSGVHGAGKLELALWLIRLLACKNPSVMPVSSNNATQTLLQACGVCKTCLLEQSNTLPDHLNVTSPKNSLGVDDIRHANAFLQKTALLGHYKTVLINQSEQMTIPAANALLKTLEEPCANSIIILLTDDLEQLLPTIVSRSRVLHIRPATGQALVQELSLASSVLNHSSTAINLTQLPELTDSAIYEEFKNVKALYLQYLYQRQQEPILLAQVLSNQYALRWLEQITVSLQRDNVIACANGIPAENQVSGRLSTETINQLYQLIINANNVIKSYAQTNKQYVCEQLIMAISDVLDKNNNKLNS